MTRCVSKAGMLKPVRFLALGLCASSLFSQAFASPSYPIKVLGGDEASFTPAIGDARVSDDSQAYDVVIVGAGLGGLSSAVYLSDRGQKVLLLEKEADVGGLASSGHTQTGVR